MSDMDKSKEELVRELADLRVRLRSRESERNRAAEAFDRESDKFKTLAENAPLGLAIIAEDDSFTYVNPAFVGMFGYEAGEIPDYDAWLRLAYPNNQDRKQVIDAWKSDLEKSSPDARLPRVFTVVCKDRSEKIVQFRVVRPAGGGRLMTCEDITHRKQAEHSLHEHVSMLERILDKAADGICVCHNIEARPFIRFTHWNPRMTEITGYSMEEINRLGWYQTLYPDPDTQARAIERMSQMREGRDIVGEEWVITSRSGADVHLSISTSVLKAEDGRVHVLAVMQDISGRKYADESLKESEKRFRDLFEKATDAMYTQDLEGNFTSANRAAELLMGAERERLLQLNLQDVVEPDDLPTVLERLGEKRNGETEETGPYEIRIRRLDGRQRWVEVTSRIVNKGGRPHAIHGIARDITDRKTAEEALRASEERFRDLVDLLPQPIFETDVNANVTFVSSKGFDFFGYAPEDLERGLPALNLIAEPDKERARTNFQKVLAGEGPVGREYTAIRENGSTFPVLVHSSPIREGDAVVGVRGIIIDMTSLVEARKALREREELYRSVIDNIEDVYYRSDVQGRLLMGSPSGARLFGFDTVEEMIGLPLDSFWINAGERDGLIEQIGKEGSVKDYEARLRKKDGAEFMASFTTHFYRDAAGHILGTEGIIRDVTEKKEVEQRLRESEEMFYTFADQMPASVFIKDRNSALQYANNVMRSLFDCDTRIGKRADEYLPPETARVVMSDDRTALEEGPIIREEWMTIKTGQERLFETRKFPIRRNDKPPLLGGVAIDITQRRQAEAALKESEAKFRMLVERIPAITYAAALDEGSTTTYVSPQVERLLGYAPEDYAKDPAIWSKILHEDDRDRVLAEVQRSQRIGEPLVSEYRLVDSHGRVRWFHDEADILCDEEGRPSLLQGVMLDITTRKEAEEALQEREATLRTLLQAAPIGIGRVDSHRVLGWTNQVLCAMLGYSGDELAGRSARILYESEEEFLRVAREKHPQILKLGTGTIETRFRRKDGAVLDVLLSSTAIAPKDLSEGVVFTVMDITERKRAEEELRRLGAAVDSAGETILVTDSSGAIIYVNPNFEETTGYSRREALGKNPRMLKSGRQDRVFYEEMWKTLKSGRIWRGRFVNRKKDGSLYEETATISPIKDASGDIVNYVAVKRDVTGEALLQKQLLQAQKMEAVGTLAGGIAHDFNNLLQAILGYADLLLMKKAPDDPDGKKLEVIQHAARDGADLVSRILTFSRKADSRAVPLDLNEEIRKAFKLLRRTVPRMIEIKLALDERLRIIDADPAQIEQILLNLAVNAQHAMPHGGQLLIETANVSLNDEYLRAHLGAKPGPHVLLTVSDTGVGMETHVLDRIFEPFFTTKTEGVGTGLGLSIVHGIVSQHGGTVRCYSEPGRGSSFKLYFPVSSSELLAGVSLTREMPAFGTETVLLVDDDRRLREMGRQMLEMGGYTVVTASNGEEAIETYANRKGEIALVILDLIMPGMGGERCLRELLRIDPDVKVLVASGYSENGITASKCDPGARGFLKKPYDAKKILEAIRKVIDRGRLE